MINNKNNEMMEMNYEKVLGFLILFFYPIIFFGLIWLARRIEKKLSRKRNYGK